VAATGLTTIGLVGTETDDKSPAMPSEKAAPKIDLPPTRVGQILAAVIAFLVLAYAAGLVSTHAFGHDNLKGLIPLFDLGEERTVPAFASSVLFLLGSIGFVFVSVTEEARPHRRRWLTLAAAFLFLALDESIAIHERLNEPVRELLGTSGMLYWPWLLPYMVGVVVLGVYVLPALFALPRPTMIKLITAAVLYVGGAVGVEMFAAPYWEQGLSTSLPYGLLTLAEESLEMCGLGLLIYAQVALLHSLGTTVCLRFGQSPS